MFDAIKTKITSINWGAVILEDNALSFGRIAGWITLFMLLAKWSANMEPPVSLVETFWALLIYNAGKKMTGPVSSFLATRSLAGRGIPAIPPPTAAPSLAAPVTPPSAAVIKKVDIKTTTISDPFAED